MTLEEKLALLSDSAKYDVSCASSGGKSPSSLPAGVCHSFTSDGRCVSLLKILLTNHCIYDCAYCINRASMDRPKAKFSPEEIASLTIEFYRRNYIEGLFLSSGIFKSPDETMQEIILTLELLRHTYQFKGYIHAKIIPGSSSELIHKLYRLADRVSSNIELPTSRSLALLAPQKEKSDVLSPFLLLQKNQSLSTPKASTQMIIGASPESDAEILATSEALYSRRLLSRVYYSAFTPTTHDSRLPLITSPQTLLQREHRLYQADWLLRFYGFNARELFSTTRLNLSLDFDPKTLWALENLHLFPLDPHYAPKEMLLRVPGIGVKSTLALLRARRFGRLYESDLKRLGISLKKARYFLALQGKPLSPFKLEESRLRQELRSLSKTPLVRPTLFDFYHLNPALSGEL